jgi:ATP-dependent DNA helicase 2 subunit 2
MVRKRREVDWGGLDIAISALVIAIQMISDHCKKLKYRRKIVLVSNGRGSMDDDGLEDIMKKITDDNIELVVLYVTQL